MGLHREVAGRRRGSHRCQGEGRPGTTTPPARAHLGSRGARRLGHVRQERGRRGRGTEGGWSRWWCGPGQTPLHVGHAHRRQCSDLASRTNGEEPSVVDEGRRAIATETMGLGDVVQQARRGRPTIGGLERLDGCLIPTGFEVPQSLVVLMPRLRVCGGGLRWAGGRLPGHDRRPAAERDRCEHHHRGHPGRRPWLLTATAQTGRPRCHRRGVSKAADLRLADCRKRAAWGRPPGARGRVDARAAVVTDPARRAPAPGLSWAPKLVGAIAPAARGRSAV